MYSSLCLKRGSPQNPIKIIIILPIKITILGIHNHPGSLPQGETPNLPGVISEAGDMRISPFPTDFRGIRNACFPIPGFAVGDFLIFSQWTFHHESMGPLQFHL